MSARAITRKDPVTEHRKFGLLVGGTFAVIALVSWWRGRSGPIVVALAAVAALLVVGAVVAPRALAPAQRAWMALARLLSRVTTPLFMGVVYFAVLTPMGIVRRLVGGTPLVAKEIEGGFWVKPDGGRDLERQF